MQVLLLQIQLVHKCVVLWMIEEEPWDYILIIYTTIIEPSTSTGKNFKLSSTQQDLNQTTLLHDRDIGESIHSPKWNLQTT
jgi:hypothetical protein